MVSKCPWTCNIDETHYNGANTLHWRQNGHDSDSNHQPHGLFRRRSRKTSKLRVTGLCVGNSPGTGEFPAQMASNAENVSIWLRHHQILNWNTIKGGRMTVIDIRFLKQTKIPLRNIRRTQAYFCDASCRIAKTSPERHDVSNYRQLDCLCNSLRKLIKRQYCWPFVRGIYLMLA